ncbi:MAG: RNA polymerase sigma factor [Flavobacteriales bacterium]|nr:RNA polymerase sigma factor [Flavobacteriales bacterium]
MSPTVDDLTREFERCKAALKSYIVRITGNRQEAEDIAQETWIKAQRNLAGFKGESSLKTWLFEIAQNIARDHLRSLKRWPEEVGDICKDAAMKDPDFFREAMTIRQTSPQGHFEIREHIAFCFTCVSRSLPLEQQLALMLKEVYEFSVKEIAGIMHNTEAMVKYWLHTGRSRMIEVFDKRCALINKEGVCHQCTELNGIFNPKQNAQEEAVKIQMVRDAAKKDKEHLFDLRMKVIADLDPFTSPAAKLQLHHLEFDRKVMDRHLDTA